MKLIKANSKEIEALTIASGMLVQHGLGDWHLDIRKYTSYNAETYFGDNTISFSATAIKLATKEQFIGMVYHEMAHALTGQGNGHNKKFKQQFTKLTGENWTPGYGALANLKKWLTHCDNCGADSSTNIKLKKVWCMPCISNGKVVRVTLTPNTLKEVDWNE